jgi:hypothetical protein
MRDDVQPRARLGRLCGRFEPYEGAQREVEHDCERDPGDQVGYPLNDEDEQADSKGHLELEQ